MWHWDRREMLFGYSEQERDGKELGKGWLVAPWAPSVGSPVASYS